MMSDRLVLIAAGGTGGHLFPAEALAVALRRLDVRVVLASDARVGAISAGFPAERLITIPSATPSSGSVTKKALAALKLGRGVLEAWAVLRRLKPAAVVGFGGYPTVPPVLAGALLGIPTIIHEQNGVIGRANGFLARRVSAVATGFREVRRLPPIDSRRVYHTGNPVRPAVLDAARTEFLPPPRGGKLRLLAFGGSQGARVMSDIVPAALESMPASLRSRLLVTQQARTEDLDRVRAIYAGLGVKAEIQPFFTDLPQRIAEAHLVIARSGASTVAELAVIGRPSILVPLPGALDQDQAANAASLAEIGAATVIAQPDFTPQRLASELASRLHQPETLTRAAAAAKSAGIGDAAERLAAVVLSIAHLSVPPEA